MGDRRFQLAKHGSSRTYELSRYTNQCTAIQIFPRIFKDLGQKCQLPNPLAAAEMLQKSADFQLGFASPRGIWEMHCH
jgi:hypothetical protein